MLTKVEDGPCGTRYALDGVIPFVGVDLVPLRHGDSIRDNGGRGMTVYVNVCCDCGGKYLAGTVIFVPNECRECAFQRRVYARGRR